MILPSCHSKSELANGPVIQERLITAGKYNWYIIRRMAGSLIATAEGAVDLVTGVWENENDAKDIDEGKTTGVDVRHCLKVFERRSCLESRTEGLFDCRIYQQHCTFYTFSRQPNKFVFGCSIFQKG